MENNQLELNKWKTKLNGFYFYQYFIYLETANLRNYETDLTDSFIVVFVNRNCQDKVCKKEHFRKIPQKSRKSGMEKYIQ